MSLHNAFEEISTEATLAELRDIIKDRASSSGDATLVSGNKVRYRREFIDPALTSFDVVNDGDMVITAGTGTLTVATGTTPNASVAITTKQTFSAPFKAAFGFKISQKIVNQEFYVEAVAVNDDGTLDESVVAAWRVAGSDSTTTTVSRVEVRNQGTARVQSANITTSTQTTDSIFEIVLESSQVQFHSRAADSTASRTGSTIRNTTAPDPNRHYALRFRIVNGAVAPASSTTFTSAFLTCVDYTEIQTEITGGPGHTNAASSMPVNITGGGVSLSNGTIGASTSTTGTSVAKINSAATTNATLIRGSVARVYGYRLSNTSASWRYVKFFNLTSTPVAGTSTVFYVIPIGPGDTISAEMTVPISHATGIGYTIVGGSADNDATAVAAGDVVGHLLYI